jgi:hypothetical protein
VTVEEALIALLAGVATLLLFLGLTQALESRPPRPARRRHGAGGPRPSRPVAAPAGDRAAAWPATPPAIDAPRSASTPSAVDRLAGPEPEPTPAEAAAVSAGAALDVEPTREPVVAGPVIGGAPERDPVLVETCASLYLMGKHAEVLGAAEHRLHPTGAADAADLPSGTIVAALWSLVALAHRALGDDGAATGALASAIHALPGAVVDACPPRLATLSLSLARRLIEMAEQSPEGAEARITAPQVAAFWLRWRLVAAPGDHDALVLLESVHDALAEGYADMINASIQRHDWTEARRVVQAGRDAAELPPGRGETLLEIAGASIRREVDRLTAAAVRGVKDENRAVAGLERADAILTAMSDAPLPPRQWAAMTRRIWRGYATLGLRRLRLGRLDEAAEALFRALAMREVGRRRQRQVRDAVVTTLGGLGERASVTVAKLLAAGDRAAARAEIEELAGRIRRAVDAGVSHEALAGASARVGELARQLESAT